MILALLALAAGVNADFEAGNIGRTEWVSKDHLRAAVTGESDQNQRNRQPSWFYFRLDGVAGRELTIDLTDLAGEYNFRPHDGRGLRNTRPVVSENDRDWTHCDQVEWLASESTLRVRVKPKGNRLWIARQPPYTTRHLDRLLRDSRGPWVRQAEIGKTVEGRPMHLLTVTNPAVPAAKKRVIWLMARQHSWESGTSWVAEGALRFLVSGDPEARRIRDETIFQVLPMCDPDGVVRGGVRFNKHGYDLNRNWDTVDAEKMPEIFWQRKAILDRVDAGQPAELFLSLHNTESVDYLQGPLSAGGPAVKALGQRLWKLLVDTTAFHAPEGPRDQTETTTPGMPGRMSVNQGLFHDRKIPAFLMELMVDQSPKLKRCPAVQDRLEFGAALARAMAASVRAE